MSLLAEKAIWVVALPNPIFLELVLAMNSFSLCILLSLRLMLSIVGYWCLAVSESLSNFGPFKLTESTQLLFVW